MPHLFFATDLGKTVDPKKQLLKGEKRKEIWQKLKAYSLNGSLTRQPIAP